MRKILLATLLLLFFAVDAFATVYYVKPDGNDSASGLSDAQAWRSISKVNSYSFATGDDVYFKCGGTWKEKLYVSTGGSSSNARVIGAYYMNNGVETVGISGNRPVIDGNWTLPGEYGKLIEVAADYVTVYGIEVRNTGPENVMGPVGIEFYNAKSGVVRNCLVHDMTDLGIIFESGSDNALIENNEVYETQKSKLDGINSSGNYGSAIQIRGSTNCVIRNNYVHGTGGEGISPIWGNDGITIEYNTVVDGGTSGIYTHSSRNITIRYNLVYDTKNTRYWVWGNPGWGIMVGSEDQEYCSGYNTNYYIYGNLVAATSNNIGSANIWGYCNPSNVKIYNNTSVEGYSGNNIRIDTSSGGGVEFKNNLVWQSSGSISNMSSGVSLANNLWSVSPPSNARASSDPTYPSYPTLSMSSYLTKTSGWSSLQAGTLTGQEFALRDSASYAIDRGIALNSAYKYALNLNGVNFTSKTFTLLDQTVEGWTIGADGHTVVLPSPTGLRLVGE
jgi:parallel beta-helix repeat protein